MSESDPDLMKLLAAESEPSAERLQLYQAIGAATTAWAHVEQRLCTIFAFLMAGDPRPDDDFSTRMRQVGARAAFHSVINFSSKLGMTHRAARFVLFGQNFAAWNTLQNRLNRQAKRRNDIVHFTLIRSGPLLAGPFKEYLSPSLQDPTIHLGPNKPQRLSPEDVQDRARNFHKLANDLHAFATLIGANKRWPEQPQEPGAPPAESQTEPPDTA